MERSPGQAVGRASFTFDAEPAIATGPKVLAPRKLTVHEHLKSPPERHRAAANHTVSLGDIITVASPGRKAQQVEDGTGSPRRTDSPEGLPPPKLPVALPPRPGFQPDVPVSAGSQRDLFKPTGGMTMGGDPGRPNARVPTKRLIEWNERVGNPGDMDAWNFLTSGPTQHERGQRPRQSDISGDLTLKAIGNMERITAMLANPTGRRSSTTLVARTPDPKVSSSPATTFSLSSPAGGTHLPPIRSKSKDPQQNRSQSVPPKFIASGTNRDKNCPTGAEVHAERRKLREERRAADTRTVDPKARRAARNERRLEEVERKMEIYTSMLRAQEEEAARVAKAHGNCRTAKTVLDEWKSAAGSSTVMDEDFLTSDTTRWAKHQRKLARYQREEEEKAEQMAREVAAKARGHMIQQGISPPSSPRQTQRNTRRRSLNVDNELIKRWRVAKGTETFARPKFAAEPKHVFEAEELVDEIATEVRGDILWVKTKYGWSAQQLVANGLVRVQLNPENDLGDIHVSEFMYEHLDEATDSIEEALGQVDLTKFRSYDEICDARVNEEVRRQAVRELPHGHFPFIRQTWNAMIERSKHQRKVMLDLSKKAAEEHDSDLSQQSTAREGIGGRNETTTFLEETSRQNAGDVAPQNE